MFKKRGGQVAIEFIFLIAVAFAISIIFSYALIDRTVELNDEKEFVAVQDISYLIQGEILIAAQAESGYERDFHVGEYTHGFDYNATLINTSLLVMTKNKEFVLTVPKVTGNIKKGWNRICNDGSDIKLETGGCMYS